ncbi:MAG: hypothetical protein AAFY46_13620, partial [Planctomycetota bacterium]
MLHRYPRRCLCRAVMAVGCCATSAVPGFAAAAPPGGVVRYIGAVDHGVPDRPGSLIAVTRAGTVHELPHAVGSDCIVRATPGGGFLVLDRQAERLLVLNRRGDLQRTIQLPAGNEPRDALPDGSG